MLTEYFNNVRQREHEREQQVRYQTAEQEQTEECSDQEVRCRLSNPIRCIHYEKLCDGVRDCERGEDEENCGILAPLVVTTQRSQQQQPG